MEKADVLSDHLCEGLRVVFCGTAAGRKSAEIGLPYAGPGNRFWSILNTIGLTDRELAPQQFRLLNKMGIGLTDIAKKASGADSDLCEGDFNIPGFQERMRDMPPALIAFNGKKAASVYLGRPTRQINYGLQQDCLATSKLFVLPSSSGAARRYWGEQYWHELARLVHRLQPRPIRI